MTLSPRRKMELSENVGGAVERHIMTSLKIDSAPWWQVDQREIGAEKSPLIVIDNFHPLPMELVENAETQSFSANAPYYPGVRAPAPSTYFQALTRGLTDILIDIFGYTKGLKLQECFLSLVTTPGKDLNFVQRLPHVDGGDDKKVALLHYLCGAEKGGTAFYRQRRTGFEAVTNARFPEYKQAVETDHNEFGEPPAAYFDKPDKRFEEIARIDAAYNRAVLYFGTNLHTIIVGDETPYPADPVKGRLTLNTFFNPIN